MAVDKVPRRKRLKPTRPSYSRRAANKGKITPPAILKIKPAPKVSVNQPEGCAECGSSRHKLRGHPNANDPSGFLVGCMKCNRKTHSWEQCTKVKHGQKKKDDYYFHRKCRDGKAPVATGCDPREIPDYDRDNEYNLLFMPVRPEIALRYPYADPVNFEPETKDGEITSIIRDPYFQGKDALSNMGIYKYAGERFRNDVANAEYHSERVQRHNNMMSSYQAQVASGSFTAPTDEQLKRVSSYDPHAQRLLTHDDREDSVLPAVDQNTRRASINQRGGSPAQYNSRGEPSSSQSVSRGRRSVRYVSPLPSIVADLHVQPQETSRHRQLQEAIRAIDEQRQELVRGMAEKSSFNSASVIVGQHQEAPRNIRSHSSTHSDNPFVQQSRQEVQIYNDMGRHPPQPRLLGSRDNRGSAPVRPNSRQGSRQYEETNMFDEEEDTSEIREYGDDRGHQSQQDDYHGVDPARLEQYGRELDNIFEASRNSYDDTFGDSDYGSGCDSGDSKDINEGDGGHNYEAYDQEEPAPGSSDSRGYGQGSQEFPSSPPGYQSQERNAQYAGDYSNSHQSYGNEHHDAKDYSNARPPYDNEHHYATESSSRHQSYSQQQHDAADYSKRGHSYGNEHRHPESHSYTRQSRQSEYQFPGGYSSRHQFHSNRPTYAQNYGQEEFISRSPRRQSHANRSKYAQNSDEGDLTPRARYSRHQSHGSQHTNAQDHDQQDCNPRSPSLPHQQRNTHRIQNDFAGFQGHEEEHEVNEDSSQEDYFQELGQGLQMTHQSFNMSNVESTLEGMVTIEGRQETEEGERGEKELEDLEDYEDTEGEDDSDGDEPKSPWGEATSERTKRRNK